MICKNTLEGVHEKYHKSKVVVRPHQLDPSFPLLNVNSFKCVEVNSCDFTMKTNNVDPMCGCRSPSMRLEGRGYLACIGHCPLLE